jgi:hypothetical protein
MQEEADDIIYCQSCGMPVPGELLLGTNVDGGRNPDYCCECYEAGAFVDPDLTMEEMAARCAEILSQELTMSEEPAREFMDLLLPRLKRWRQE